MVAAYRASLTESRIFLYSHFTMPLAPDASAGDGPRFRVGAHASVAVELSWALAAGRKAEFRDAHPTLVAAYGGDPELHRRVRDFWGPEVTTCCGYMEVMVLAHRVGLLLSDDAPGLLDRLEEACALPVDEGAYELLSETAEDRAAVLARLARLRESDEARRAYVRLLRDVWEAVGGDWERYGRGAVDVAVQARRDALGRGTDWHEVARGGCDFGELLDQCVSGLGPGDEVAVVPAFFTHQGLLFDLPGTVVVGVRTDTTGVQARARTEVLARRLKALSDPTRLALVDALRSGPHTITELAAAFGLAQPTVSNHVRILREAELVTDEREGTRRRLTVRVDAADELLSRLQRVLTGPPAPPAHGADTR